MAKSKDKSLNHKLWKKRRFIMFSKELDPRGYQKVYACLFRGQDRYN